MSFDAPHSCARDVYQNYLKLLLSVFYVVCQSLSELRHLVSVLLSEFRLEFQNQFTCLHCCAFRSMCKPGSLDNSPLQNTTNLVVNL